MPKSDFVSVPSSCTLCPRRCGADRAAGRTGFCGAGGTLKAARAALHYWEEPCISGTKGSGTVFFSGCTLKCCFCQNYPISAEGLGKEISVEHLAEIFLNLQEQGANNINLVTPGQWRPWIIAALDIARANGLHLPIVCNTGGYETVESVEAWRGYIDIWLADLKYVSSALSAELSSAPDYFAQAKPAIEAMMAQAGHPVFNAEGILQKGVILRHLALPGHVDDSFAVLDQMAAWNDADPGCFIPSVMSQYTVLQSRRARHRTAHYHLRIPPGGQLCHGQGTGAGLHAAEEQRKGRVYAFFRFDRGMNSSNLPKKADYFLLHLRGSACNPIRAGL